MSVRLNEFNSLHHSQQFSSHVGCYQYQAEDKCLAQGQQSDSPSGVGVMDMLSNLGW